MDAVARQEYREFAIEFGEERIPAALTADPSPPAVWYAHQDPPQSIGELAGVLRDVKGVGVLLCVKAAHDLLNRPDRCLEPCCVIRCSRELSDGALERVPPHPCVRRQRLCILAGKPVRVDLAHSHYGTEPAGGPGVTGRPPESTIIRHRSYAGSGDDSSRARRVDRGSD